MSVCAFTFLPNGEHLNFFDATAFSGQLFSINTSLPVKNSYLLTFPDNKAEVLVVYLSKSY